jgi:predicted Fe-Mo cluster-binding NifX family protein
MKVAVCSTGNTLESQADPRFGRCAYFIAVDTDTLDFTATQNPGIMSAQGAGIQAAQVVASLGVSAVVAGNFGPNAHQALSAAGVKVYTGNSGTVRQVVEQLKNGQLQEVAAPTVAAHFGMGGGQGPGSGMGRGGGMGGGGGMGRGGGGGRGSGGR